jgi:hypothetical protein
MSDANTLFVSRPLPYRAYPMRHDNLVQEGSLLWEHARTRLQALLAQVPRAIDPLPPPAALAEQTLEEQHKQRWIDYWNGRAPHTSASRRVAAEQSFLDHLQAAAQLAYYHGQLTHAQLLPLLRLLEGAGDSETQPVLVETVALKTGEGTKLRAVGALVITADSAAQLLYLPTQNPALRAFADRQALQTDLLRNRSGVFQSTTLPVDTAVELSYQTAQLSSACKQWLSHCRHGYLEAARASTPCNGEEVCAATTTTRVPTCQVPFATLPAFQTPEPTENADNFAAFGSLSPDIPQSHRWAELKRQHQAMLNLLADDLRAGTDSPGWVRLKAQFAALTQAQARASQAAAGLLAADTLEDLYRLRYLPNAHYSALYQARVDGVRAEVALQEALGLLSTPQVQLMQAMLSNPQASKRKAEDGIACAVSLSFTRTNGAASTTQVQQLHGVVAFMPADA